MNLHVKRLLCCFELKMSLMIQYIRITVFLNLFKHYAKEI